MENNKYVAINTKLKGMESRFLTWNDYEHLLMCDGIESLCNYLKKTESYKEILAGIKPEAMSRASLEERLDNFLVDDIARMKSYFSSKEKKFINTLYTKYEISDMKRYARTLCNRVPERMHSEDPNERYAFLGKFSNVDKEKIFSCKSLRELVLCYEKSPFFKYISPMLEYEERMDLFRFETLLDLAYYTITVKESRNLAKKDRLVIEEAIGTTADLYNLQWILRAKIFYKMHPAVIFNYTISFAKRISKRKLQELCYTDNVQQLIQQIKSSSYAFLIADRDGIDNFMRNRLKNYIYRYLLKLKREYSSTIIGAFAHSILLQYQQEDITTLIEAKKYNLAPEETKKYLIVYSEKRK